MSRPAPKLRAAYQAFYTIPTRWKDNDAYGHMNNAEYLSVFDTALSYWMLEQGWALTGPEALRFVVVESGCRYFAESGFPDVLHVGLRVGHLGRSSVRFELGLFRNGEDVASSAAFFVHVLTGPEGRPVSLPEGVRDALAALG
ncbi:acyl-CoA thioesterase [Tropicibacter naphthalenivorans]|uniref:Acyl-CoA thioester hydrolase, YbgC/YbaW family n=1 Tax=Tropicibacter naphthalenivorans TaxID=441103 RepID=A0A0P1G0X3_9RHOB|nr:thioesterase family protein [Tropicibacter naphthalenivorans]CUH75390.1 acyl-CoA thioester hydrolase, YbgC/YbaW family [Tropicibacter naphthalenivorans]SMC44686.1 acyl-CoA thioester hydrolase [Tropicibacter naphthalenivorans]